MKSSINFILVLVIAGAGAYYYFQAKEAKDQTPQPAKTKPLQLPQKLTPEIQHPITEPQVIIGSSTDNSGSETNALAEIEEPLPLLEESDDKIKEILSKIFGADQVNQIFTQRGLINRFVVTIDTLPKKKLANKYRLFPPISGKFLVQEKSKDKFTIGANNFTRYSTYIQLLNMLDTKQFVKWYKRFYPLIQEAYDALGYKNRYFNDRFIFVIDHLLKTPKVEDPIQLVRPTVFYKYADPALEALSAGQKILLRIGPANAEIVKAKLVEIRKALTTPQFNE